MIDAEIANHRGEEPTVVIEMYRSRRAAEAAAKSVAAQGIGAEHIAVLAGPDPTGTTTSSIGTEESNRGASSVLKAAEAAGDIQGGLIALGVPEGEARFYESQLKEGNVAVAFQCRGSQADPLRKALREQGGYDVTSLGRDLVRGEGTAEDGEAPATRLSPASEDLTGRWEDVRSRYRMLWGQHFGAEGGSWEDYEPYYADAWRAVVAGAGGAGSAEDAEERARRLWERGSKVIPEAQARAVARDVWQDVADDRKSLEGGEDRRVVKPIDRM